MAIPRSLLRFARLRLAQSTWSGLVGLARERPLDSQRVMECDRLVITGENKEKHKTRCTVFRCVIEVIVFIYIYIYVSVEEGEHTAKYAKALWLSCSLRL